MNSRAERQKDRDGGSNTKEENVCGTDKTRSRICVNIGLTFQRWRELKEWKACDRTPRLLWFFSIGE